MKTCWCCWVGLELRAGLMRSWRAGAAGDRLKPSEVAGSTRGVSGARREVRIGRLSMFVEWSRSTICRSQLAISSA